MSTELERPLPDRFMDFIRELGAVVEPGEAGIVLSIGSIPVVTMTRDQAANLSEEDKDTFRVLFDALRWTQPEN